MTTAVTVTDRSALAAALRDLKLSGMLETLDARLAQAHAGELGHLDFLQVLCQDEISRRETTSLARRIRRARFEEQATLEGFDFGASPKLPAAQIRDLAALRWLAGGESVILYGRRRQEPHRPGPGPPRHPLRRRSPVPQDQPGPGPPGRRPGRPHLGQTPRRAHPPGRPGSRSIRGPQPPVRNVASVGRDDCFLTSACRYPRSHANVGDVGMMSGHGGAACPA